MVKQTTSMPAVGRTSSGLRDALFDELDAIRSGASNPTRANAVAKIAGSIVETVRMEIEVQKYAQHAAASPTVSVKTPLGESLKLGG